jgi:hypothetical protein
MRGAEIRAKTDRKVFNIRHLEDMGLFIIDCVGTAWRVERLRQMEKVEVQVGGWKLEVRG